VYKEICLWRSFGITHHPLFAEADQFHGKLPAAVTVMSRLGIALGLEQFCCFQFNLQYVPYSEKGWRENICSLIDWKTENYLNNDKKY